MYGSENSTTGSTFCDGQDGLLCTVLTDEYTYDENPLLK